MSMSLSQQSPPLIIAQEPFSTHSTHGSIGPVIAVLVVIIILGILAVMIGRLCSGKRIFGHCQYDLESWAEVKCSSCIDGRMSPPPPRPNAFAYSTPASSEPAQTLQETRQEGQSPPLPPEHL